MNIPLDKQGHFFAGATILLAAKEVTTLPVAFATVMLIAAMKEGYDYLHPAIHSCDVWDWVATTVGGAAALAWILAVRLI